MFSASFYYSEAHLCLLPFLPKYTGLVLIGDNGLIDDESGKKLE
jgi:hypothetical protein